jgi:glycosyltransferase involved in cell wall biosynthesis
MSAAEVPTLVFAGRVGWLVQDLMQQLENCRYLDGKVVIVPNPTDSDLVALYRGCRFTLFPSLYEGWGLPVTESLSFGKLCVASDRTSIPEAGGPFCLYIDPEDISGATETIRRACTDDALVAEREAAIREGFRPVPWRRPAEVLAGHLGLLPG